MDSIKPKVWTDEMLYGKEYLESIKPKPIKKYRLVEIVENSEPKVQVSDTTNDDGTTKS